MDSTKKETAGLDDSAFYSALESAIGHPLPANRDIANEATEQHAATCRFTLVIPALNEEDALAATLIEALSARETIVAKTPVTQVDVVLVNDGSTDRTQDIAESFDEVNTVRFEQNRGYGAAIKAGFQFDQADLVGFMDADGTLQAESFVALIKTLFDKNADIVLGARLNPESEMPLVRRLGNRIFARLLGLISGQPLSDCASGMRVVRRSALRYLMPLPDGLHFTPAMSCNAVLDRRLKICEQPVPYAERVGESKLNVLKDGVRFLSIILLTGCFYNPVKCAFAGILFSWMCALCAWLGGWDGEMLVKTMIGIDVMAIGAALVCHHAVKALIVSASASSRMERWLHACAHPKLLAVIGFVCLGLWALLSACLLLDSPKAMSKLGGASLALCFVGVAFVLLGISLRMMQLIRLKFEALLNDPFSKPCRQ